MVSSKKRSNFLFLLFLCVGSINMHAMEKDATVVEKKPNKWERPPYDECKNRHLRELLGLAIQYDQTKETEALLDDGLDHDCIVPNVRFSYPTGITALAHAARFNSCKVAKLLLERKADVNKTPLAIVHSFCGDPTTYDTGITAVHEAMWNGSLGVLKILLQYKPDLNRKFVDSHRCWADTPLMLVVKNNDPTALELLLKAGADCSVPCLLNCEEVNGFCTPLEVSCLLYCKKENKYRSKIFDLLLAEEVESDSLASKDTEKIIKVLMEKAKKREDDKLLVPNQYRILEGFISRAVKAYCAATNLSSNSGNNNNETKRVSTIEQSEKNKKAVEAEYLSAKKGCHEKFLEITIGYDQVEDAKRLLAEGLDSNCMVRKVPAIGYAARVNSPNVIEVLLKQGADIDKSFIELVDYNTNFDTGRSAVHLAVENGSIEALEVLLRHKPDVNKQIWYPYSDKATGSTPLMVAVINNFPIIVRMLLKAGADHTIVSGLMSSNGRYSKAAATPLGKAYKLYSKQKDGKDYSEVFKLLLGKEIDVQHIDSDELLEQAIDAFMEKIKERRIYLRTQELKDSFRQLVKEAILETIKPSENSNNENTESSIGFFSFLFANQ